MIPLRLELKNFMSYGEGGAALDLAGMHMLALTGENGHGKSALLDALTWALWGESRAGKNRHDDLVRIGADEMSVNLTFQVEGQTYRVLRKRSKKASGNLWELHQLSDDGQTWRALTGNKSGDTGDTIQRLLRMSYDTFLNSAYLRQGQADHFVQQTPGKRKEILGDILDLSRYDKLEARAKLIASDAKADATDLERDLNALDAELSEEAVLQAALLSAQTETAEVQSRTDALLAEHEAVKTRLAELGNQQKAADILRAQSDALARETAELAGDADALHVEIGTAQSLLSRRADIEARHAQLLDVRAQLDILDENVRQLYKGRELLAAAQMEYSKAEHALRLQVQRAADLHAEASGSVKELDELRRERDAVQKKTAHWEPLERDAAQADADLSAAQEHLSRLKEEAARMDEQIKTWQDRLAALDSQQGGTCQVCNAPLTPERTAAVREEYQAAWDDLLACRKDGYGEGKRAKSEVTALQDKITAWKSVQKQAQASRDRLLLVERELLRVSEMAAQVPKRAAHLAELQSELNAGRFAPELRARIEKYERGLAKYADAEDLQMKAKAEAAALASAERDLLELTHAQKSLDDLLPRLSRTQAQAAQKTAAHADLERQLSLLADIAPEMGRLNIHLENVTAAGRECRRLRTALDQQVGSLAQRLQRLAGLRTQRGDKEAALSHARRRWETHEQLARAFGKKGVQALIIDNAVPELMDEANRLLERLTDGDMSLFINTVREGKAKNSGPIETLDIQVSDSLGTRPLEMYSGGEGFRAAFALRIALSRLLARRAGAKLQTLIIDEGFGTQDGKGREKLVDALQAISTDFEKIIVITHIDELKDAFPTRVEVTKTPAGSQVTVLEGAAG